MSRSATITNQARTPWQGARQILRFNWPMYAWAGVALGAGAALLATLRPGALVSGVVLGGLALAAWWSAASILASHWVYDRSRLFELGWLEGLAGSPGRWASVHAGLDEFSGALRGRLGAPAAVLDIYDAACMTEPSISRARAGGTVDPATVRARHDRLPLADGSIDAVFLLFAAHELRTHTGRVALMREVARVLGADGRAVVLEHLRDGAGFVAFGPGFLHFQSRRTWLRAFEEAGLGLTAERTLTPLARVFVLQRRSA